MPTCVVCERKLLSIQLLKKHLKIHSSFNGPYKCKEPRCYRSLTTWEEYRRHLKRGHMFEVNIPAHVTLGGETIVSCPTLDNFTDEFYDCDENSDGLADTPINSLVDLENYVKSLVLSFIFKLYANPRLPRSHVQEYVEDATVLLDNILSAMKPFVRPSNSEEIVSFDLSYANVSNVITNPLKVSLSSEFRRLKLIDDFEGHIKARDYVIGDRLVNVLHEGRIIQDRASVKAKFVPMREVLKQFLSLPGVLDETLSYLNYLQKEKDQGLLSNFVQAELWQQKCILFGQKLVLPLFVYYDDFEVNNPLGSRAAVNKIGGVYFSIPCLPPKFRARVENIFTAVLFKSNDRKNCFEGNDAIFTVLVEELNFLFNEGILVNVNGKPVRVYFSLGLLISDNEALNSSMGFVASPSANYYCRMCKMSKIENRKNRPIKENQMRTPEQYAYDGFLNESETGVKENSIWNLVDNFHVVQNPYVDPAHDLLEGVCRYDMGHILYYLICEKNYLSVDLFNAKIRSFNYSKNGFKNKIPQVKRENIAKKKKVLMSASEMHTFVLLFPFLVEGILTEPIDLEDEVWEFFFVLRQIMDICFAKSVRAVQIDLLDYLVDKHNSMYIKLFNDTLKPKFHNMKHFKHVILMSGPLAHLSLLRYESKHQELKAIAMATASRLYIIHTVVVKEQLRLCYRLHGGIGLREKFDIGDGDSLDCISLAEDYVSFCESFPSNFSGPYLEIPWVNLDGIKYNVGSYIVLDVSSDGFIEFGKIFKIFANEESRVCFVCEKLYVESFCESMHAYEVSVTSNYMCIMAENLFYPFLAIHYCLSDGSEVIALRHSL